MISLFQRLGFILQKRNDITIFHSFQKQDTTNSFKLDSANKTCHLSPFRLAMINQTLTANGCFGQRQSDYLLSSSLPLPLISFRPK